VPDICAKTKKLKRVIYLLTGLLMLIGGPGQVQAAVGACPPDGYSREQLAELKAADFEVQDDEARNRLAVGLMACLSDPDPLIRDGVAFEAVSGWLRNDQLAPESIQAIYDSLVEQIGSAADPRGFEQPFAALLLSEVARVDRGTKAGYFPATTFDGPGGDVIAVHDCSFTGEDDDIAACDPSINNRLGQSNFSSLIFQGNEFRGHDHGLKMAEPVG